MSIEQVARWIREGKVVALTGAGVSTESGIPDFRSADAGIWRDHDPSELASLDGFMRDPSGFYAFWGERFGSLSEAEPNATHRILARLESEGYLSAVITQNIDGLHGAAGSERVLEVHGSFRRARCLGCGRSEALAVVVARVAPEHGPLCAVCGALMKPDVVLFGEALPPLFTEAERCAVAASLLLVLGSSLEVYPVAGLVPLAHRAGARVVIVNRDPGPYDDMADIVIHAELGRVVEELEGALSGLGG